ncbi:MAG TPA: type II toxin-antitoxin system RelE/ParE family toxin [Phycisphaerae bacterium]|nr:type II toxin-antitoxin system RelE/ParE family toxin [Phycisphaerales bacterium]HRX83564.1 type II toxin-antitoxin system RelE/ParE family toxin [Phycisphaerae bacterium]
MKRFHVRVTAAAHRDLRAAYRYIHRNSPTNAVRWREGFLEAGRSLELFPERCPLALEADTVEFEIRQLVYGNYRILFTIQEQTVVILHLRHAARDAANRTDLDPPSAN